ncbi:hypothetical protein HK104_009054 [Borealophlyctis nickersoniae]|nr:hypothetical protein HK104_009054 [Borealophlyctis nickersoniae]
MLDDDITITMAEKDILEFLRHRGRDLEYFRFPKDPNSRLAPLIEFLPNVRTFSIEPERGYRTVDGTLDVVEPERGYRTEDVVAFINHADKLENLDIGIPGNVPQEIRDVAIARGVRLTCYEHMPDYALSREESWMGL